MGKKVFISQPMNGKTLEQIIMARQHAAACVDNRNKDVEFLDTYYSDDNNRLGCKLADACKYPDLAYLAISLLDMADCDAVVFAKGWEEARGCKIEHEAAEKYGLEVIHEE